MASETLTIRRLATRFRLERGARVSRPRLKALVWGASAGPLEAALARVGIPADEEICIRRVEARTALDLARTDAALAIAWSASLAAAIRATIDRGGDEIVRYPSRRLALVDVVLAAARGELGRAWAWRQLGLWPARDVGPGPDACTEAARVLAAHPRLVVPVLREVVRRGALGALLAQLPLGALAALAEAVLPGALAAVPSLAGGDAAAPPPEIGSRLAQRSILARAGAEALATMEAAPVGRVPALRRALAVLCLVEAEPGALLRAGAPRAALVAALDAALAASTGALGTTVRPPHLVASAPASPSDGLTRAARDPAAPSEEAAPATTTRPPAPEPQASVDSRERGTTRAAGLLFLIQVVGELELPRAFVNEGPLDTRPLPWTLHRLAQALLPLADDDPATLAFAGLGPRTPAPTDGESPTAAEARSVDAAAERVVDRLRLRLARPDQPRDELLREVCARRGEIVADPGWIELRLDLQDVSLELRRAGLDLDPDWVPWLGVVVRFVYA